MLDRLEIENIAIALANRLIDNGYNLEDDYEGLFVMIFDELCMFLERPSGELND